MRALAYFTIDPKAHVGPSSQRDRTATFAAFCREGMHNAQGVFHDPRGEGGGPGWRAMIDFIRERERGYLVVIPGAGHLGDSIEQQIARVLELDALSCQAVCDDPERPDPLQNALRSSGSAAARRERIREGMKAKAARGLGLGKPPYGYRIAYDGTFGLVPAEAETVALIFRRYVESGGGVRGVAAFLNEQGRRTRTGRRWSMVTVRDILRNTAYIGTYRRFGLRIPSSYEPIVTPSQFRQVQDKMHRRSPARRGPRSAPFLLSGVIFCGYCGQRMMGVRRRQTWRRKSGERAQAEYRYYQCQSRINRNQCDYRTVRADDIEERALRAAREKLASGEHDEESGGAGWLARERAQASAKLRALDRRFLEGVQRAASGGMTLGQLRIGLGRLQAAKRGLEERIRQTTDESSARVLLDANADRFLHEWEALSEDQRRDLVRALIVRVTVKDGGAEVSVR